MTKRKSKILFEIDTVGDTKSKPKEEESNKKNVSFSNDTVDNSNDEPTRKKSKKQKEDISIKASQVLTEEELVECNKPENVKNVSSKRAQKRKKYEELKVQQKLETEVAIRQKSLNYLSLWKHNRSEWKFAKVRQIWLQKHMFDSDLIPDESFNTLIEYFCGAKGHIRETIIKECMEIIENLETEEEQSENDQVKFSRARNMLQCLEE